jgi:hypothetical protein
MLGGLGVVTRGRRWFAALGLMLAQVGSGYGSNSPAPAPASGGSSSSKLPSLFDECTPGQACESGLECIAADGFARCEHLCQSDADCDFTIKVVTEDVQAVCGTLTKEVKACAQPCDEMSANLRTDDPSCT